MSRSEKSSPAADSPIDARCAWAQGPRRVLALSLPLLAAAACIGPASDDDQQRVDSTHQAATQGELPGVIFPDDSTQGQSCQQGVPLVCPSSRYSLTYFSNILTATLSTKAFLEPGLASISSNGQNMVCTGRTDFSAGGIEYLGAINVPTRPHIDSTGTAVVFDRPILASQIVPAGTVAPPSRTQVCSIPCDPSAPLPSPCNIRGTIPARALVGQLSVDGGPVRDVQLKGSVDFIDYDDASKRLRVFCKMTVKSNLLTVTRTRPSDVIAASGNTFVRGYDLTGSALTNACSTLAQQVCQPNGAQRLDGLLETCITPRTNQCVFAFSNPDPCRGVCVACSNNAICGLHQTCTNGCCTPSPF